MRRMFPIFVAVVLVLASGQRAAADFIYQFTTTVPAGIGGSLSATITAPNSAVATGIISPGNIASLLMQLSGTSPPFVNGATTNPASLSTPFLVNPATGAFMSNRPELFAPFTPETVTLMPSPSNTASYQVTIPDVGPFDGAGVWSVTHTVPEPTSLMLAGLGGCIVSAVAARRRRCRERPSPVV